MLSDANARRMLHLPRQFRGNRGSIRLTRIYAMYTVMDSKENRPATPKICQGQSERILKPFYLPRGTYSYASLLKIVIYDLCGH